MQRLAALVPRPRLNLIRFHGVLAPNAKLRPEIVPGRPVIDTVSSDASDDTPRHSPAARMSWARLLKRVFKIDVEHCPHCGGTLKIIAAIEEPSVITKILAHLGLPTRHLRYAIPASLAVQPSHPGLSFAAQSQLTHLGHRHDLSICSQRPNFTPAPRFNPVQLPSRPSPLATASSMSKNATNCLAPQALQRAR